MCSRVRFSGEEARFAARAGWSGRSGIGFVLHESFAGDQFLVRFVVRALGGRGIAVKTAERITASQQQLSGDPPVRIGRLNSVFQHLIEHSSFKPLNAAEAPTRLSHLLDQERLVLVRRSHLSRRQASRMSNSSWSSCGRTLKAPDSPCLIEFRAAADLPSGVFGPVERRALFWLATI